MTTATQTTQKGKNQLPADMVRIPTESTAKRAKAMRDAQALTREQIAIQMALNLLSTRINHIGHLMMAETAKDHDDAVLECLNLVELGEGKLEEMRGKRYQDYDDCIADFIQIGSLVSAISKVYGERDTAISRSIKGCLPCVDVMMTVVELQGGAA